MGPALGCRDGATKGVWWARAPPQFHSAPPSAPIFLKIAMYCRHFHNVHIHNSLLHCHLSEFESYVVRTPHLYLIAAALFFCGGKYFILWRRS